MVLVEGLSNLFNFTTLTALLAKKKMNIYRKLRPFSNLFNSISSIIYQLTDLFTCQWLNIISQCRKVVVKTSKTFVIHWKNWKMGCRQFFTIFFFNFLNHLLRFVVLIKKLINLLRCLTRFVVKLVDFGSFIYQLTALS